MRVLQIYNQYRSLFNGEENVVHQIDALLRKNDITTKLWMRSSRDIENSFVAKAKASTLGVYNPYAYRDTLDMLLEFQPDVVHAHNIYPLFSPAALAACRERNVPVVMSLHNQGLTCPKSDHLRNGSICEKCVGGKEYHCALNNCRGNMLESIAYAARFGAARKLGLLTKNVTLFLGMTEFARKRLVDNGYPEDRVKVLPNKVELPQATVDPGAGEYVAFAGRLSPEKGINVLLGAAGKVSTAQVHLAGSGPDEESLKSIASENVTFRGRIAVDEMSDFYRKAKFLVLPSICFEMCPLTILEAMSHGLPVIASRIGGLGELVDDGETGYLFEPGNDEELAYKMACLWESPELCRQFGEAGRRKAEREYSEAVFFDRLMGFYQEAIEIVDPTGRSKQPSKAEQRLASFTRV